MIVIDFREKDILNFCNSQLNGRDIIITSENLPLGDIKIDKLLIERKTINDLAASIVDGRYKEQSFRLNKALDEGYKIFYFIEGNMDLYTGSISKNTLISTIYSLTHKGFQVLLTKNSKESSLFILQFAEKMKIEKCKNEKINTNLYSEIETKQDIKNCNELSYENTEGIVQKKKNKNITKENISVFMLCQIPGISITTAGILLKKYGHISKLIIAINNNPNEMNEFEYIKDSNIKDSFKKLNKNIIKNLNEFLISE
jgi:ERCC4-type nuclease